MVSKSVHGRNMAQHMRGLEGLRLESLDQKSGAQAWLDAEQHLPLLGLVIQIQAVQH